MFLSNLRPEDIHALAHAHATDPNFDEADWDANALHHKLFRLSVEIVREYVRECQRHSAPNLDNPDSFGPAGLTGSHVDNALGGLHDYLTDPALGGAEFH